MRPSRKFGGSQVAIESEAVQPAHPGPRAREYAIDYARQRFGGSTGEVRVFSESGQLVERFTIDGRDLYPHAS